MGCDTQEWLYEQTVKLDYAHHHDSNALREPYPADIRAAVDAITGRTMRIRDAVNYLCAHTPPDVWISVERNPQEITIQSRERSYAYIRFSGAASPMFPE